MENHIQRNMITPEDAKRKIPFLQIGTIDDHEKRTKYQSTYAPVDTNLTDLAETIGYGWNIIPDFKNKILEFNVRSGEDRSIDQTKNDPIIFNKAYGNSYDVVSTQSYLDSKTVVYAAGQGEGAQRTIVVLGAEKSGFDREEVFADARSDADDELQETAEQKLANLAPEESYEFNVLPDGFRHRKYNLGDTVTVVDREFGEVINTQITEIEEDDDGGKYEVYLTFGTPKKTLLQKAANMKKDTFV